MRGKPVEIHVHGVQYSLSQVAIILLVGAIGGIATVLVAHRTRPFTREILAAVLIVAAAFYVLFAAVSGAGSGWITTEVIGVVIFGGMGVVGVRGSAWWLAAGWALHPVWDLGLHYFGAGRAFAPEAYVIACMSWDWITAAYVAFRSTSLRRS